MADLADKVLTMFADTGRKALLTARYSLARARHFADDIWLYYTGKPYQLSDFSEAGAVKTGTLLGMASVLYVAAALSARFGFPEGPELQKALGFVPFTRESIIVSVVLAADHVARVAYSVGIGLFDEEAPPGLIGMLREVAENRLHPPSL